MKLLKRNILIIGLISLLVIGCMIFVILYTHSPKYMLSNMDIAQIESIAIYSLSMENVAILSESDVYDLFQLLKQVEITGRGSDDFRLYAGTKGPMFYIKLKNRKGFDLSASNPFYIIDSKGYRHDNYEICNHILYIYYPLVEKYFPR